MKLKGLEIWIERNSRKVLAVILGINLSLSLVLFDPKLDCGGDNTVYIALAESILRANDGYSLSYYPGPPKPYTVAPFGYPLLLAPFFALFGQNLIVFKLLSLCFSLGSLALCYILLKSLLGPLLGTAITLAVALNLEIISYSHWILSEIPFLFFSLLSSILFLKSEEMEKEKPGSWFLLAIASIAYTAHIRTIGLVFAGGGFLYYALHRKFRKLVLFTLGMTFLLSPWLIRNNLVRRNDPSYMQQLMLKDNYNPEKGIIEATDLVSRIKYNIQVYTTDYAAQMIFGSVEEPVSGSALRIISSTITLLVIIGLVKNLIFRAGVLELYILFYLAVLSIWPEMWADVRFLIPVIPFLIMYLIDGTSLLVGLVLFKQKRNVIITACIIALLVALTSFGTVLAKIPGNLRMIERYLRGDCYTGYLENWRNFFDAADWARENTPKSSTFTLRKPELFAFLSKRKSQMYPLTTNKDSILTAVFKTDYVLVNLLRGKNQLTYKHNNDGNYLLKAMEKKLDQFSLVFQKKSPYTYVWKTLRPSKALTEGSSSELKNGVIHDIESFRLLFSCTTEDINKAISYYKKQRKEKGLDFEVVSEIADLFLDWGQEKAAADFYELAAEINPTDEYTLYQVGKLNQKLKNYDKSKKFFQKLLDLNPLHISTLVNLGSLARIEKKYELAEQYYKKALAIDSTNATANNNYGNLLMLTGRHDLAEKHYKIVLQSKPNDGNIHGILAGIYWKSKRYEESLRHFRILTQLVPEKAEEVEKQFIKPLEAEMLRAAKKP